MTHNGVESELKIPVEDHETVREALRALGAATIHDMAREENLLLDSDERRLAASGCVLRLRRYGRSCVLTFKGPVRYEGPVKVRPEYELEIGSAAEMRRVLEALGFNALVRYQKDRESWRHGDVSIVLDRTPMGNFVEVEGPIDRLEEVARAVGLDPAAAVRGSYVSLWRTYRARHPDRDLPEDMVFTP